MKSAYTSPDLVTNSRVSLFVYGPRDVYFLCLSVALCPTVSFRSLSCLSSSLRCDAMGQKGFRLRTLTVLFQPFLCTPTRPYQRAQMAPLAGPLGPFSGARWRKIVLRAKQSRHVQIYRRILGTVIVVSPWCPPHQTQACGRVIQGYSKRFRNGGEYRGKCFTISVA